MDYCRVTTPELLRMSRLARVFVYAIDLEFAWESMTPASIIAMPTWSDVRSFTRRTAGQGTNCDAETSAKVKKQRTFSICDSLCSDFHLLVFCTLNEMNFHKEVKPCLIRKSAANASIVNVTRVLIAVGIVPGDKHMWVQPKAAISLNPNIKTKNPRRKSFGGSLFQMIRSQMT